MVTTSNLAALATSIPSPTRSAIAIGPLTIHAYALAVLLGVVAAALIGTMRYTTRTAVWLKETSTVDDSVLQARNAGTDTSKFWNRPGAEHMLDVTMWCVPFGILGARIYHVITHWQSYFGPGRDWTAIFRIWEGGLAIIGGIAFGALGAWIVCRRRGISFPVIVDALAPGLLVAQAIGRFGNWFNQELFGSATTLPWGLQIDARHLPLEAATGYQYLIGTLFHPTFLYESLWNLAAAALLIWIDRRFRLGHGRVFFLYIYLYCLGRTWIELLRMDSANVIGPLRVNSWAVMILGTAAIIAFAVVGYFKPGREADSRLRLPSK